MNRVEVFQIEYIDDIEEKVNEYCGQYELNPISISVVCHPHKCLWIVSLVVEVKGGEG